MVEVNEELREWVGLIHEYSLDKTDPFKYVVEVRGENGVLLELFKLPPNEAVAAFEKIDKLVSFVKRNQGKGNE